MLTDDYYAILRVSPEADGARIRDAYRALMRRYHPDVNGSVEADHRAKSINEAYACLRDASKRARYDRLTRGQPAARKPFAPPSPAAPFPPTWGASDISIEPATPRFQPTWWKAAGLGGAMIVTAITFALTSATPPVAAPVAKNAIDVRMKATRPPPSLSATSRTRPPSSHDKAAADEGPAG